MLNSRVAFNHHVPFPGDDVAMAFVAAQGNIKFQILHEAYNYQITPDSYRYTRSMLKEINVLHYHKCGFDPKQAEWILAELEAELPEFYDWLKSRFPLKSQPGGLFTRLQRKLIFNTYSTQRQKVVNECKYYGPES